MKLSVLSAAISFLAVAISNAQDNITYPYRFEYTGNPLVPHVTSADPSAHVWDGTVWVYTSGDGNLLDNGFKYPDGWTYAHMDGYRAYSTTDMINWIDHGEIFHSRDCSWGGPGWMWAPSAARKDGVYYLYYPHKDLNGEWQIGVATASRPQGPFTDTGSPILGASAIDPMVYMDDDGQPYMYFNGPQVAKLKPNMIELAETPRPVVYDVGVSGELTFRESFEEGGFVHKYKNKYYFTYSHWQAGSYTAYQAIGNSPYGPFEWKGPLAGPTRGAPDHHSIIEFKGAWYYFSHMDTPWQQKNAIPWYGHRRISIYDRMFYNADGTIMVVYHTYGDETLAPIVTPAPVAPSPTMAPTPAPTMPNTFKLVYVPDFTDVMELTDGDEIDPEALGLKSEFNVEAVITNPDVTSVKFVESDVTVKAPGPFMYCGFYNGWPNTCQNLVPSPGTMNITAIPYIGKKKQPSFSVTFSIPTPQIPGGPGAVIFKLIHVPTNTPVVDLVDGAVVDPEALGVSAEFNVEAFTNDGVTSLTFAETGATHASPGPYYYCGDFGGWPNTCVVELAPSSIPKTVTAVPTVSGKPYPAVSISFTIVEKKIEIPGGAGAVIFKLIHVPTNTPVMDLVDGAVVDPEVLGVSAEFNVEAFTNDGVTSLTFAETGATHTSPGPYYYCGDFGGWPNTCIVELSPSAIPKTVTAVPTVKGKPYPAVSISFTIVEKKIEIPGGPGAVIFKLIHVPTNTPVMDLVDGAVVDPEELGVSAEFNVEAFTNDGVTSLTFAETSVTHAFPEPYYFCGDWEGWPNTCAEFSPSFIPRTVTATPVVGSKFYPPVSISFTIKPKEIVIPGGPGAVLFRLIYVPSKEAIMDLYDGAVVDPAKLGVTAQFTVEAVTNVGVTSVAFEQTQVVETKQPFYFCGYWVDWPNACQGLVPGSGPLNVTATPSSGGTSYPPVSISFSIL